MRDVIRSICWIDDKEKDSAKKNLQNFTSERLVSLTDTEQVVVAFVLDFYEKSQESPQLNTVHRYFEKANAAEETVLLEESLSATFYQDASFTDRVEQEVEEQSIAQLRSVLRETNEIATKGMRVNGAVVKGNDAAVEFILSSAQPKPPLSRGVSISLKDNSKYLDQLYADRKSNPSQSYGALTGYGLIDAAAAGIKKKQLYFLAGFGGHLKSTLMMNMILNAAVDGGWNIILFSSEMPADDIQLMLCAIHSAHPKFNGVGRPLRSFQLLLGAMNKDEEAFFPIVKEDLLTTKGHGSIRVVDSGEFISFSSIRQRTIREHAKEEVDILWMDYLTRLPVDAAYIRMDQTTAKNETIADAKRFAMSFNHGEGLAVCSPFQINRDGYRKAKTSDGRMDLTALAAYNAAEREADLISYTFFDLDEQATSEPKIGLLKVRWGRPNADPVSVFIEPDSRRIFDMTSGLSGQSYAPTAASDGEDEVEL